MSSSAKELSSSERAALQNQIKELGDQIRILKTEKANPDEVGIGDIRFKLA